jgi:hypothetical protein
MAIRSTVRNDAPRHTLTIAEETAAIEAAARRREEEQRIAESRQEQLHGELGDAVADFDRAAGPSSPFPEQDPLSPCRYDGWTVDRQRRFFSAIAGGQSVTTACQLVGMTRASAYAFRRRAGGSAFALGWQAAALMARDALADVLYQRAVEGVDEEVSIGNGRTMVRTRYDHRLGLALLNRLDRQADRLLTQGPDAPGHAVPVQVIASHWDEFIAMIGTETDAAATADFIDARRPAAGDMLIAGDADRSDRAHTNTPESCQLRQLSAQQEEGDSKDKSEESNDIADALETWLEQSFRLDEATGALLTVLPPPADFAGDEQGEWGDPGYQRSVTEEERAVFERCTASLARFDAAQTAARLADARLDRADLMANFEQTAARLTDAAAGGGSDSDAAGPLAQSPG